MAIWERSVRTSTVWQELAADEGRKKKENGPLGVVLFDTSRNFSRLKRLNCHQEHNTLETIIPANLCPCSGLSLVVVVVRSLIRWRCCFVLFGVLLCCVGICGCGCCCCWHCSCCCCCSSNNPTTVVGVAPNATPQSNNGTIDPLCTAEVLLRQARVPCNTARCSYSVPDDDEITVMNFQFACAELHSNTQWLINWFFH